MSAKDSVLVMYSGGLDSTLAAALMTKKFKRIILLTYRLRYTIFVSNSKKNVEKLRKIFPDNIFEHQIVECNETRKRIWSNFANDYFAYCKTQSPGIICLGCKMAMLVDSIKMCLKKRIGHITNGMISSQSDHPECMPSIVNRFADFMREYNIIYVNDLYQIKTRNKAKEWLKELGIKDLGIYVGASNITLQPRCFLGAYSTLWKASRPLQEKDMQEYFDSKIKIMHHILEPYKDLRLDIDNRSEYFTRVDDSQTYEHAYEFSAFIDKVLSICLSPLWWLSRSIFYSIRLVSRIFSKQ